MKFVNQITNEVCWLHVVLEHILRLVLNSLCYDSSFSQQVNSILVEPSLIDSLPKNSFKAFYEKCAIVGHSGSLIGSNLGNVIDGYDAVFRYDEAPSAYRFAADVGRRTTFQVLEYFAADASMPK